MTLHLPHRLHSSAPHTRPGAVCVGRVRSAVRSAPDRDFPQDAGGRAHAAVPPPGAPAPPALLQQRAAPAGDPAAGEEGAPLSPALWFVDAGGGLPEASTCFNFYPPFLHLSFHPEPRGGDNTRKIKCWRKKTLFELLKHQLTSWTPLSRSSHQATPVMLFQRSCDDL